MILYLFAFLGGVGLFLYGMELLGGGLQQAAGARLQKVLQSLTGVPVMGVILGALVTATLQSSTATTVMSVGLVNAGVMTLKQAFSVVMGANIGTTLTAQLIAFNLTDYFTVMIFIGVMIRVFAKHKNGQFIGQIMLGFGLLMLGMKVLSDAAAPMRSSPMFVEFISRFADNPVLAVFVGIILTILIQSSAATVGILMVMASQGLLPLEGAIPVILGDNIGTCLTAIVAASRSNASAKQVALSHVLFNSFGCVIFILFMPLFLKIILAISPAGDIARQIANSHSAFNVLNTLIFLPLITPFTHLIEKIMPDKGEKISFKPQYLNDAMLETPSIAIVLAEQEVLRMGEVARKNLHVAMESLAEYDADKVKYVLEHEPIVDKLNEEITRYLTHISEKAIGGSLAAKHMALMHACIDIERIGDHAQTLVKRSRKIFEEDIALSPEARQEVVQLGQLTEKALAVSLQSFADNDMKMAEQAWSVCRQVKAAQKEMRKNHIRRLNEGACHPDSGLVFLELLINMKRTSDHAKNICQMVLGIF
ncbi:MAG: Na/Pi cotransporter family protein [Acidaminococcaceae bacterium]|nr:Na/Pi cotransporter family protein [Acidaminococcaceae bacterium]MBR1590746.1 Na/Pi cotransporter family protein [Acidaminococcaceae bacterium]